LLDSEKESNENLKVIIEGPDWIEFSEKELKVMKEKNTNPLDNKK